MGAWTGPTFQLVKECTPEDAGGGGFRNPSGPLLVRGAVKAWPAWSQWSFDALSRLRRPDGSEVQCRFQEGLVEQGATRALPVLPVAPYLEELGRDSQQPRSPEAGLLPEAEYRAQKPEDRFSLRWDYLKTIGKGRRYLADWPILHEFPHLRRDFAIRTLWPGWRWTWEYVFIGPSDTVTGLHQDIHDNWFCQVRGTKELLLFPQDQSPHLFVSGKYNLGSVLSEVDILNLQKHPDHAAEFGKTRGYYARVNAGDALYIPKHTWHAVIALEPSISLGIFGLTAWEVVTAGAWSELKNLFHLARLYRWRNCICHESPARS
ncbi:MAG TPA: cupin-like domain-containing protein [Planctomycetota bacterium]|nr:cupin-like domain-containing protein [Planctomycetota bacterium]